MSTDTMQRRLNNVIGSTVLSYAMQNGARTPKEAHNRAYAADTLRLADRIVDYDAPMAS